MLLSESKLKGLATVLHKQFCQRNHTEDCAWFYENERENPWEEKEHKVWLKKAYNVIKGSNSNFEQIMDAISTINEIRPLVYEQG